MLSSAEFSTVPFVEFKTKNIMDISHQLFFSETLRINKITNANICTNSYFQRYSCMIIYKNQTVRT